MSNIYVNIIGVPRKPRNKRIYGGNSFVNTNANQSATTEASKHFEIGTLQNLTSANVVVYFTEVFTLRPTLLQLKVYRMVQIETNKWVIQDVATDHSTETFYDGTGFSLVIEASESLTGIIIEYAFA